ncbi:hypothetical protein BKA59DRAFT_558702 [Fusarium tricinctum]|uniref:C2H2-type domain-containing protein n=1 Tax=Fusarium tricinctum TaxID=61284 RepID=A0A8K0RVN8_9HYPO|nr:hypothetical protein BKA59DRAFT_558702 [Fusarium tricinctum]
MATSSSHSVADYVLASLNGFEDLCDAPHIWESSLQSDSSQRNDTEPTSLLKLKDEQSRFMVWSRNVGAHRSGHSSLDHRLRDASNIRDHIIQILCDLIELLGDTKEILERKAAPNHQQQLSLDILIDDSDDEGFPLAGLSVASELSQILLSIAESIDCLFRLSVTINNHFPHDHLKDASSTDCSHFESYDIKYVRKRFSTASDVITERLGKANSRRRQYFKYRELRRNKLASGQDDIDDHTAEITDGPSSQGLSLTDFFPSELQEADAEPTTPSTSYAMSDTIPGQQHVPALPEGARDGSFECPFCFLMISAPSEGLWKKHVFSDLGPYICLELDCPAPDQDFQYRHQWIDHVRKYHWKIWTCCLGCDNTFISLESVVAHLTQVHSEAVTMASFKSLLSICEKPKPVDDSAECPLCKEILNSFEQYQRHVAYHQEDLALVTLAHMSPSRIIPGGQGYLSGISLKGTYARILSQHHGSEAIKVYSHTPEELPDIWVPLGSINKETGSN